MLGDLSNKSAFVTGGGQGIGRGIALVLAQQGAKVAIADMAAEEALAVAEEIRRLGREALELEVDVTNREQVDAAVSRARDTFGQVDILVNNAGIGGRDWQAIFAVNVMGVVHCCEAVVPHMKERQYGKIITIGSQGGHAARRTGGAYPASKAAVLRYTKGLAFELATMNINVNAVCPGAVWTAIHWDRDDTGDADAHQEFLDLYEGVIPMGRTQTAEDIGKAVAFLASDDAANITGQCLHVDGGVILRD